MRLSVKDAVALRLAKHHLDRRAQQFEWLKVIRDIGGVQLQSMPAACIALWARVDGFSGAAVENALVQERTLVKTWAMRETVHLLPSEDFTLFAVALRAARRRCGERLARRGVSPEQVASAVHVVQELLAAGPVTRKELSERAPVQLRKMVTKLGPYPWDEFLKDPSFLTEVCFGPPRGAETTFVSPRRWLLANVRIPPVPRAEEELCCRYLRAFGPATPEDFAYWSGFPIGDARAVFDRLSKQIVEVDVDRARAWVLDEDLRTLGDLRPAHSVRLLPNFDAFLLGHKDKSQILDVRHYKRVFSERPQVSTEARARSRCTRGSRSAFAHASTSSRTARGMDPDEHIALAQRWFPSILRLKHFGATVAVDHYRVHRHTSSRERTKTWIAFHVVPRDGLWRGQGLGKVLPSRTGFGRPEPL